MNPVEKWKYPSLEEESCNYPYKDNLSGIVLGCFSEKAHPADDNNNDPPGAGKVLNAADTAFKASVYAKVVINN